MSRSMDYSGFYGTLSKKQMQAQSQQGQNQKGFRSKPLMGWTIGDVCDWLDSLFLPEYKPAFIQAEVDGLKLADLPQSIPVNLKLTTSTLQTFILCSRED